MKIKTKFKIATPQRALTWFAAITTVLALTLVSSCKEDEVEEPNLTVTSFTPTSGGPGTVVEVIGEGFSATASENLVKVNGIECPVTAATTTKLTITIPANASSGAISVTVGGKTAQRLTFTFIPPTPLLAIASISPTTGPKNTVVTITGTAFSTTLANNVVKLNDKVCTVTEATATQLKVTIPAGSTSGKLKVTVGTATAESQTFDYVLTIVTSTFAGSTEGFADGTGTAAQFKKPKDLVLDAAGNLFVTDADNFLIRKITPAGVVSTFAGSTQGSADGTGSAAQFSYTAGIAIDGSGNLYVADENNQRIRKITSAGAVTTLAGSSTGGSADGTGAAAQFNYPTGVAVDGSGNVYVADKDNHRIRKITPNGVVTTFAGSGEGSTDGTGTAASFKKPKDLVLDAAGNLFVTDADNFLIRKITPAGVVTTFAGSTEGAVDGTGSAAKFSYAAGIAIDASGNLYLADENNQKVRKITSTGIVTTLMGTTNGFVDGDAATARFSYPTGVAVDASGNIYVADKDNHRIRKITID
jgi:sugar lactone lactonase YvrE